MAVFSSSLMSCLTGAPCVRKRCTGMLLRYFLIDFVMTAVATFISGYHLFAFHICCGSVIIPSQSGLILVQVFPLL
jgi:hypothetical protein